MRLSILLLIPLLTLLSTASTGQQCDTVKRQALIWYTQRNECREYLDLADRRILALERSDSLSKQLDSIRLAEIDILAKAIQTQGAIITKQRRTIVLLRVGLIGAVVGFIILLVG